MLLLSRGPLPRKWPTERFVRFQYRRSFWTQLASAFIRSYFQLYRVSTAWKSTCTVWNMSLPKHLGCD